MKLIDGDNTYNVLTLNLDEGDVLVVDFKDNQPNTESLSKYREYLKDIFPNNRILFISNGIELGIIKGGSNIE